MIDFSRRWLIGLLLCLSFATRPALSQPSKSLPKIETVLPPDGSILDVMQLVSSNPKRLDDLTKTLAQAIKKDPNWWASHLKNAKPGEPVPYVCRAKL
jgi:hypothetical protein